ncbi:MAG TPA: hypothetical protein VN719_10275, partial [Gemmatimonadales bacterium]|nr:hypothetical protein [Gemmatimonadales bacterium]
GDSWHLAPGALAHDTISDRGVFTRYLVRTGSGRPLGCLPVQFTHVYDDVLIRLSQRVRCPGTTPLVVHHGRRTRQDEMF